MSTRYCFAAVTGPEGSDPTEPGECKQGDLGWTDGSALWKQAGLATYAAGLMTAFILVVLAAGVAAGRTGRLAAGTTAVATATATAMGVLFLVNAPVIQGAEIDRGVSLFVAGLIVAAVAAGVALWASRRGGATPVPT